MKNWVKSNWQWVAIVGFLILTMIIVDTSYGQDPRPPTNPPSRPAPGDCPDYDPFCSPISPLAEPELHKVYLPAIMR